MWPPWVVYSLTVLRAVGVFCQISSDEHRYLAVFLILSLNVGQSCTYWTPDKRGAQKEMSSDSEESIDEPGATTYLYSCRD